MNLKLRQPATLDVGSAVTELQTAALAYIACGWALTWMDHGAKFPEHKAWNAPDQVITTPEAARRRWNGKPYNIGLVHALGTVKTCSFDVDKVEHTRAVLAEFGIDLDAMRVGMPCVQGNPANFRLIFRQPAGHDLPLVKLEWPAPDGAGKLTIFELRAGANQDVLPPSLHPSGKAYEWIVPLPDDPADHPEPPTALLELWLNWQAWEPALQAACPWAKVPKPKVKPYRKTDGANLDIIGQFNAAHGVRELLEAHRYQPRGKNRYLPPNSTSGVPSVRILDSGKAYSDNGSCPLNDGHAHDAFSVFCILEHHGEVRVAVRAAAELLGLELKSNRASATPGYPDHDDLAGAPPADSGTTAANTDGATSGDIPSRPATIQVRAGYGPEMADIAEAALMEHDPGIFQRSGYLCRIARQQAATVRGITRPTGAVTIAALDVDFLLDRLNRAVAWTRYNKKADEWTAANAPRMVATTLLARSGLWRFPILIGVVAAPTLRPDGSILDRPGYDPATGLYFDAQGVAFPAIPQRPTREQARAALDLLIDEVLARPCLNSDRPEDRGFSFASASDRSAALAAILTALVRHSLPTAPLFLFNATRPASAKSLLADCVSLIATGRTATVFELGEDPDEVEKRLLAVLLAGDPVINLDNLEQPLGGSGLCKTLTAESITGRILGVSKNATVPTITTWLATGNNVTVIGDMTRRTVVSNLDPQSEAPQGRRYDRNLVTWIPEHRARLAVAGLTVLRGYIAAGRPAQPYPPMGSFEDWDTTIRRALTWLGEADPLAGTAQLEDADPVRLKLRALLVAWYGAFRAVGATAKEAIARARETVRDDEGTEQSRYPMLRDVLEEHFTDRRGDMSSRIIGDFIKKYARRVEIGSRFEHDGISHHAAIWRVKILDPHRWQKFSTEGNSTPQAPQTPQQRKSCSREFGEFGEFGESVYPRSEYFGKSCATCRCLIPEPNGGACGMHERFIEAIATTTCGDWQARGVMG